MEKNKKVELRDLYKIFGPGNQYVTAAKQLVNKTGIAIDMPALREKPEDLPALWDQPELTVTNWGTVRAQYGSGETELDGVYAVGDIVRGASLVVWAIRDGRDCADAILARLNGVKKIAAE